MPPRRSRLWMWRRVAASGSGIGEGRWFDSEVHINGVGPYHCVTSATIGGQCWVLGAANYNANLYGYVGLIT
jgi:hypothetical protein